MAKKKQQPKAPTPARRKGMPVHRVPDMAKKQAVANTANAASVLPRAAEPPRIAVLESLADASLTQDQLELKKAGKALKELMDDDEFAAVAKGMVVFRQAFSYAYAEFQRLLAARKGPELPTGTADLFAQFAVYTADKAFDVHRFMDDLIHRVMPWLAESVDARAKIDMEERGEALRKDEEDRRARPIPIGFHHTPVDGPELDRSRSLVFVGKRKVVAWLLDRVCAQLSGHMAVRLTTGSPSVGQQSAGMVAIAGKAWHGCCDSDHRLAVCMGFHAADRLSRAPDVMVCDDLAAAFSQGWVGRPAAANAGDAHRRLRKWCDKGGVALVAGVEDEADTPDVSQPQFLQLRTFTMLRLVTLRDGEDGKYRVVVGDNAAVFDVDRGEIDRYERSGLILSGW
jgi:hypothetical protein